MSVQWTSSPEVRISEATWVAAVGSMEGGREERAWDRREEKVSGGGVEEVDVVTGVCGGEEVEAEWGSGEEGGGEAGE